MEIQINNETQTLTDGATVHDVVVNFLQLEVAGMAVALNDAVVPKSQWEQTELKAQDKLLVIKASSGG